MLLTVEEAVDMLEQGHIILLKRDGCEYRIVEDGGYKSDVLGDEVYDDAEWVVKESFSTLSLKDKDVEIILH